MTLKQKRAISYAIYERKRKRQDEYIKHNGLTDDFKNSKYKSVTWFLKAKGVNIF